MTAERSTGRPRFHVTPPVGWLNDPNGLVFADGEYHLFYQHNPDADVWGPMHWGHAVSRDLVRWEHLPIALAPDELGWIYSGSAVVDRDDDAGFGRAALVAVFTHASTDGQVQSLAYSCDRGRTWRCHADNPVLAAPDGEPDFRDPKVFRWERDGDAHWVMVLAMGSRVRVYTSLDLRSWDLASELAPEIGVAVNWETPDLFPLPVDGTDETQWVLSLGVMAGAPAGGTGTCYFVGQFDGCTFTPDGDGARWADQGADFYAAQSWNDVPTGERVWIAWMANWLYADRVPSDGWRGVMTCPRRLGLTRTRDGLRLVQEPVGALDRYGTPRLSLRDVVLPAGGDLLAGVRTRHFDVRLAIRVDGSTGSRLELQTRVGPEERTSIVYDLVASTVWIDRHVSGRAEFHRELAASSPVLVEPDGGLVTLRVLGDACSVEVFADGGAPSQSALVFPDAESDGFALIGTGGSIQIETLELFDLSGA